MPLPLIHVRDIHHRFGEKTILSGAELSVAPRERICLVGRNGSGKSTFLRIAAGEIEPDSGERWVQPGVTVRYLPQEPDLSAFPTVHDYVGAGLEPGDDLHAGTRLLHTLGLTGDVRTDTVSGGEARRAALARALAPRPNILLLDEPTNHLDLPAIEWLESTLPGLRTALVVISHDRRFLSRLTNRTVWLDRGTTRRRDDGFSGFEDWRDRIYEQEEADARKLDRRLAEEAHWLRYGVTARRKRNQGRLRRMEAMRDEREARNQNRQRDIRQVRAAEAGVSGKCVIEAQDLEKRFGERVIVTQFSARIARGDRVGIIGPNGIGKTTLLSILTGQLAPDLGNVKIGTELHAVSLDQRREVLDPAATLAETLTGGGDQVMVNGKPRHVIGYMRDFLFLPDQARTPVGVLSGGERGRLMLARALARPANLMILDEPTNDLDLETLDLLEDILSEFSGTLILVSHDRDFLDRVVTSTIAPLGEGHWREYAGGYTDMMAQGPPSDQTPRQATRARPSAPQDRKKAVRPKLTFRDKHAYETLPAMIEGLDAEIASIEATLAESDLYARDADTFTRYSTDLEEKCRQRQSAEEEWLRIALLIEEIEKVAK